MKRCHSIANEGEGSNRPAKKAKVLGRYQNTRSIRNNADGGLGGGAGLIGALLSGIGGGGGGLGELFQGILGGSDDVTQVHNHIYFKTEVTMESIKKLTDLIDEANREHERQIIDDAVNFLFPKPIYLHITSNGGDLFAGFLAYDAIRNSKVPIYTVVDGYAVSSGSIMFMAGRKRFMTSNSYILIHQLSQTVNGTQTNADVMDDAANNIELMTRLYQLYLTEFRHGYAPVPAENILTKDTLEQHMAHDIYWNFQTCFKYGLAGGVFTNYQQREETDRREFYQSLTGGDIELPTYAEVTGSFEREQHSLFGDREAFAPGPDIQERISIIIQKNAETRKHVEDSLKQSALGQLLNNLGDSGDSIQFGEDEPAINLADEEKDGGNEGGDDDVRVIETRSNTRNHDHASDGSEYFPSEDGEDTD
jgi:ATP-dependent protease ClpP protease subunit